MSQFGIRPQEIYLIERYSSVEYFKELVDAFKNMLDAAENALELFMQDLPYDYRNQHISQQPDIVWGEHVLPNFRSTLESLNYGYKRLLEGDLSALQYAGNVNTYALVGASTVVASGLTPEKIFDGDFSEGTTVGGGFEAGVGMGTNIQHNLSYTFVIPLTK